MQEHTCQKCNEEISEEAIKCPDCGYEPSNQGKYLRDILKIVGVLLCMTVVGALIGIPLILLAEYSERKMKGRKPTNYNPA